ncbi:hypothetical protein [Flexithrix dorotheae]|uniref:hypothetical protein n=1 Tax=Flexithrix dorotheae TaxID=70993 RepID=UPI0003608786|nr:hypothetical protein [Flexithrix dorotheae]
MNANPILTKGHKILLAKAALLPPETAMALEKHALKLTDANLYLRADVTGKAGILKLIDETTIKQVGITNIDGNKLPKFVNQVVEKLRAGYATHATETDPSKLKYTTKYSAVDTAILNSVFTIKLNEAPVLEVPTARLFSEEVSRGAIGSGYDAYIIDNPPVLIEEMKISMEIEFPKTGSVDSGAKHFIELFLQGQRTAQR